MGCMGGFYIWCTDVFTKMYGCIYKCVEYMGEINNWEAGRRKLMEGRWAL